MIVPHSGCVYQNSSLLKIVLWWGKVAFRDKEDSRTTGRVDESLVKEKQSVRRGGADDWQRVSPVAGVLGSRR